VKPRESATLAESRWAKLRLLQEHYKDFETFLVDAMAELGFGVTDQQFDIAKWLAYGPLYLMVQAQRSQAKTTITACFAVWSLIHMPHWRVLIVTAAEKLATEVSTMIVRLISHMEVLACMRPDEMAGDRSSVEAFDVHHSLKGMDKSPSVSCVGITGTIQGLRADILIADDVESAKNSETSTQRAKIAHITKDFTSICASGRIVWLGTPQTNDSLYNSLTARGVAIRVWPGRFPNKLQMDNYGARLAPRLRMLLERDPSLGTGGGFLGDQGHPTDPQLLDEEKLQKKERDQGTAHFQLQHMLSTAMTDAMRYPLKPIQLVTVPVTTRLPMVVVRGMDDTAVKEFVSGSYAFRVRTPHEISKETLAVPDTMGYVDPAAGGKNADETAYAIGAFVNGNVWGLSVGGLPGGYDLPKLEELARRLLKHRVRLVKIEKNMGYGAFRAVFTPVCRSVFEQAGVPVPGFDDDLVVGQKEKRIINTLGPVMGRGALVLSEAVFEEDSRCCEVYDPVHQNSYSLFHQLAHMTTTRDALEHDDRADALEGLVRHFQEQLVQDQKKQLECQRTREFEEMTKDLFGDGRRLRVGPPAFANTTLRHRRGRN
jgi:hypothetical protein